MPLDEYDTITADIFTDVCDLCLHRFFACHCTRRCLECKTWVDKITPSTLCFSKPSNYEYDPAYWFISRDYDIALFTWNLELLEKELRS